MSTSARPIETASAADVSVTPRGSRTRFAKPSRFVFSEDYGLDDFVWKGFETGDFADDSSKSKSGRRKTHNHYVPLGYVSRGLLIGTLEKDIEGLEDLLGYYSGDRFDRIPLTIRADKTKVNTTEKIEIIKFSEFLGSCFPRAEHPEITEAEIDQKIKEFNEFFRTKVRYPSHLEKEQDTYPFLQAKREGDRIIFSDVGRYEDEKNYIFIREADGTFKIRERVSLVGVGANLEFAKQIAQEEKRIGAKEGDVVVMNGNRFFKKTIANSKGENEIFIYRIDDYLQTEKSHVVTLEEKLVGGEELGSDDGWVRFQKETYKHAFYIDSSDTKDSESRKEIIEDLSLLKTRHGRPIFDVVQECRVPDDIAGSKKVIKVEFESSYKNPREAGHQLYDFVQTSNRSEDSNFREEKYYRDEASRYGGIVPAITTFGGYAPWLSFSNIAGQTLRAVGYPLAVFSKYVPIIGQAISPVSDIVNATAAACFDYSAKGAAAVGNKEHLDDAIRLKAAVKKNAALAHGLGDPEDYTVLDPETWTWAANPISGFCREVVSGAVGLVSSVASTVTGGINAVTNYTADFFMKGASVMWSESKKLSRKKGLGPRLGAGVLMPLAGLSGAIGVVVRMAANVTDALHIITSTPAEVMASTYIDPSSRPFFGSMFGLFNKRWRNLVQNHRKGYFGGEVVRPEPSESYNVYSSVKSSEAGYLDIFRECAAVIDSPNMNKTSDTKGDEGKYIKLPKVEFGGRKYKILVGTDGAFKVKEDTSWVSVPSFLSQKGDFPESLKGKHLDFLKHAAEQFKEIIAELKKKTIDFKQDGLSLDRFVDTFVVPDFGPTDDVTKVPNLTETASKRLDEFLLQQSKAGSAVKKEDTELGHRFTIGTMTSATYVVTISKDGRIGVGKQRYGVDLGGVLPKVDFTLSKEGKDEKSRYSVAVPKDLFEAINIVVKTNDCCHSRGSDSSQKTTWKEYVARMTSTVRKEVGLESEVEGSASASRAPSAADSLDTSLAAGVSSLAAGASPPEPLPQRETVLGAEADHRPPIRVSGADVRILSETTRADVSADKAPAPSPAPTGGAASLSKKEKFNVSVLE